MIYVHLWPKNPSVALDLLADTSPDRAGFSEEG